MFSVQLMAVLQWRWNTSTVIRIYLKQLLIILTYFNDIIV
jgi:hypothetical protein